jgi:hypothetical protein
LRAAALRGGDGKAGGAVTNRSRRTDLVHVLAPGTSEREKLSSRSSTRTPSESIRSINWWRRRTGGIWRRI